MFSESKPLVIRFSKVAAIAAAFFLGSTAQAIHYDFSITFDGVAPSLDGGSDAPAGTVLEIGDTFTLDIHAAGNDYWMVLSDLFSDFVPASFATLESATRTANIMMGLYLDGGLVQGKTDLGATQQFVHIGAQLFDWNAGTMFDQVIVEWEFLATDSAEPTTIADDFPFLNEFYYASHIEYVEGGAKVPDTGATASLLAAALLGAAALRRRLR